MSMSNIMSSPRRGSDADVKRAMFPSPDMTCGPIVPMPVTAAERNYDTQPPGPPSLMDQCRHTVQRLFELESMTKHLIAVLVGDRPVSQRFDNPKKATPPDASTVSAYMLQIGDSLASVENNLGLVLQEIGK